jgi:hypothetical protein
MAKYLDQTGLKYFWGKIKAKMPGPLQAYPVGSVYISISSNFNPNTSFGGTWERFGQGRTLIGEGTGNDGSTTMSFTANSTGGNYVSKDLNCGESRFGFISYAQSAYYIERTIVRSNAISQSHGEINANVSLIQPYIVVYFWRRIA